jgi:hypothetical protein
LYFFFVEDIVFFYFATKTLSNRSKNVTNRSEIDFWYIKNVLHLSDVVPLLPATYGQDSNKISF